MTKLKLLVTSLFLISLSYGVSAQKLYWEANYPMSQSHPLYPGLELQHINKIKLWANHSVYDNQLNIQRVDFDFEQASDISIENFTRDGDRYRAELEGAWVFRKVILELETVNNQLNDIRFRLFVAEQENYLSDTFPVFERLLLEGQAGFLMPDSEKVVDQLSQSVEQKTLNLTLFDRASLQTNGELAFRINSIWFGKGERTLYIPVAFPIDTIHLNKAIAIVWDEIPLGNGEFDYMIGVSYADQSGYVQTTPMLSVQQLLDDAYINGAGL
ncbi:hypothetical protein [Aliikangiella maris]|uniref:Uncharacterized protein n=2 Tax=Aliikangiella maris TaxID=3162458 RepID=A0ABV3MM13_9GAMM